jgi:extradiol dioxygenase family protein
MDTVILHISIPVADLEQSASYYESVLRCAVGRRSADFVDVWFFGAQLTLLRAPAQQPPWRIGDYAPHYGAIVGRQDLDDLWQRVVGDTRSTVIFELTSKKVGTPLEQTKFMFSDPDGHAIELKSYTDIGAALGSD